LKTGDGRRKKEELNYWEIGKRIGELIEEGDFL
jgi:hypothetical protein